MQNHIVILLPEHNPGKKEEKTKEAVIRSLCGYIKYFCTQDVTKGNLAICVRPMAFRPCFATGLAR
jgi:hypothetical protein